jgi:hypothetical protein
MISELKKIVNSEVDTPNGKATLREIYVTELGYIMAKLFYKHKKVFINYKIGEISTLLESQEFNLLSEWTKRISIQEKLVS